MADGPSVAGGCFTGWPHRRERPRDGYACRWTRCSTPTTKAFPPSLCAHSPRRPMKWPCRSAAAISHRQGGHGQPRGGNRPGLGHSLQWWEWRPCLWTWPRGRPDWVRLELRDGDSITVDGSAGTIMLGTALRWAKVEIPDELFRLLEWADELRAGHLGVRANADDAFSARLAREFGADGRGSVPHRAHVSGGAAPDHPASHHRRRAGPPWTRWLRSRYGGPGRSVGGDGRAAGDQ